MTAETESEPRYSLTDRVARVIPLLQEAVGPDNVLTGALLAEYADPYSFIGQRTCRPSAVVRPGTVGEVQAIVRAAVSAGTALWTVSRGKNLAYGGASPRVESTIVLDLQRMQQILEVNEECGYAIVEPGVSFFALAEHLREIGSQLMPSVPDLGWGSVIGNTLERGFGYSAHGDHSAYQCGMEVVLADGTLVRTGMGAKEGNTAWAMYKGGYGPSVDGLFFQSNLGVVTKMGIWLHPRGQQTAVCTVSISADELLPVLVDTIRPLLLDGTVQSNAVIGNATIAATTFSTRSAWWQGPGPLPAEVIDQICAAMHFGRWNARFACYGPVDLVAARLAVIERAIVAGVPGATFLCRTYGNDIDPADVHPADRGQLGIPGIEMLRMAEWRGGTPAHTDFSLVCAPTGEEVGRQMALVRERIEAHGFDYAGGFTLNARHAIALALVSFDRDDPAESANVEQLFLELIRTASEAGYAPYRAHLAFMDVIADQYDHNDSALRRLVTTIKAAVDPHGILSPGKQGIWPPPD